MWRNKPFANDHLDAFFNASVDAGEDFGAFNCKKGFKLE